MTRFFVSILILCLGKFLAHWALQISYRTLQLWICYYDVEMDIFGSPKLMYFIICTTCSMFQTYRVWLCKWNLMKDVSIFECNKISFLQKRSHWAKITSTAAKSINLNNWYHNSFILLGLLLANNAKVKKGH